MSSCTPKLCRKYDPENDDDAGMVKGLSRQLESMIVEDWREYYLDYPMLKGFLHRHRNDLEVEMDEELGDAKDAGTLLRPLKKSVSLYGTLENTGQTYKKSSKFRTQQPDRARSSLNPPHSRRGNNQSPRKYYGENTLAGFLFGLGEKEENARSIAHHMQHPNLFDNSAHMVCIANLVGNSASTTDDEKYQGNGGGDGSGLSRSSTYGGSSGNLSENASDNPTEDNTGIISTTSIFPGSLERKRSVRFQDRPSPKKFNSLTLGHPEHREIVKKKARLSLRRRRRRRRVTGPDPSDEKERKKSVRESWLNSHHITRITEDINDHGDYRIRFWMMMAAGLDKAEAFQSDQEVILKEEIKALKKRLKRIRSKILHCRRGITLFDIKGAFILAYRSSIMLRNFAALNFIATKKLAIKYCKQSDADEPTRKYIQDAIVDRTYFTLSRTPDNLSDEIVETYSIEFENGSRDRAVAVLQTKMTDIRMTLMDSFRLGVKSCLVMVFVVVVCWELSFSEHNKRHWKALTTSPAYETYRGLGFLLLIPFLWSIDIHLWQRTRVNYVYIFEFDPRRRLTDVQMFEVALNSMLVYIFNLFLFIQQQDYMILKWMHQTTFPTALWLYFLAQFLAGFSGFGSEWNNNSVLLESLSNVLIAPFGRCRFYDSIVADVLTSTVKIWIDVWHVLRWYSIQAVLVFSSKSSLPTDLQNDDSTGAFAASSEVETTVLTVWGWISSDAVMIPLLSALPLWIRFQQCINRYYYTTERHPHLSNAFKYALAHTIVIAGTFHPTFSRNAEASEWTPSRYIWLVSTITSTLYTFVWDVTMDWGLGYSKFAYLRRQRLFTRKYLYYWAVFSNLFLRFSWTFTLTPFAIFNDPELYQYVMVPTIIFLELFRRFQWAIFRVEWEHIKHSTIGFQTTPIFFDNEREKRERERILGDEPSLLVESFFMIMGLIIIGVLAAVM